MRLFQRIDRKMAGWFRKTICGLDLWCTFAISLAIAVFGNEETLRNVSSNIGLAQVQIGTALLGIVLAGLAILVVFLDEKYIKLLEQISPGFDADLWPFKATAFIAIVCAAFGMVLIIIGDPSEIVFRSVLFFSLWSFSYLLWNMFDLIKFIAGHAKNRIEQINKNKN